MNERRRSCQRGDFIYTRLVKESRIYTITKGSGVCICMHIMRERGIPTILKESVGFELPTYNEGDIYIYITYTYMQLVICVSQLDC